MLLPIRDDEAVSYRCKKCEVTGHLAADEPKECWSCGKRLTIVRHVGYTLTGPTMMFSGAGQDIGRL
jgi:rRNA maturation endonuclease Nob1